MGSKTMNYSKRDGSSVWIIRNLLRGKSIDQIREMLEEATDHILGDHSLAICRAGSTAYFPKWKKARWKGEEIPPEAQEKINDVVSSLLSSELSFWEAILAMRKIAAPFFRSPRQPSKRLRRP